jgi:hypothetical protein
MSNKHQPDDDELGSWREDSTSLTAGTIPTAPNHAGSMAAAPAHPASAQPPRFGTLRRTADAPAPLSGRVRSDR